ALGLEVDQQLVEIDAGPSFEDRHDPLVILDRRQPREVELVEVIHEDAPLLRLGDEVVHRAGAEAAILRDVELADRAARAHRFEDRVRSRDRLAGLVRRRRAARRSRGRTPDLLGVLRAAAAEPRPHGAARRRAERRAGPPPTGRPALLLLLAPLVRRELPGLQRALVILRARRRTRRESRPARGSAERLSGAGSLGCRRPEGL